MSDEILARIEAKLDRLDAGQAELRTGQDGIRQELGHLRSEMRDELAAIRREANERQELYLEYFRALVPDRSNLRHAS